MIEQLKQSPALQNFCEAVQKESSLLIENLWDAPKAALLLLTLQATQKHLLIITGDASESRLLDDLSYFGIANPLEFPSWETLPGEEISPSPDIIGRRFEILYTLLNAKKPQILFTTLQGCLQKVVSPPLLKSLCTVWKRGDEILFHTLSAKLESLGYRRAAVVSDKGEFAQRGGIIDIFPLSSPDPFRIEFFGDTIEEIRSFDPIGQKSIAKCDHFFLSPAWEKELLQQESATLLDYFFKKNLSATPLILLF